MRGATTTTIAHRSRWRFMMLEEVSNESFRASSPLSYSVIRLYLVVLVCRYWALGVAIFAGCICICCRFVSYSPGPSPFSTDPSKNTDHLTYLDLIFVQPLVPGALAFSWLGESSISTLAKSPIVESKAVLAVDVDITLSTPKRRRSVSPERLRPPCTPSSIGSSGAQASSSSISQSRPSASLSIFFFRRSASFTGFGSLKVRMNSLPSALPKKVCAVPWEYRPIIGLELPPS